MPIMDGLEAMRRLCRMDGYATLPIIAMTANAFAEDRRQCEAAGINGFLTKPSRPELLYATLLDYLRT